MYRRADKHSGTASLATLVDQRTLHNLRSLVLYTNVETQDIAHHLENASLFAEYAYVSTASAGNHSRGGDKLKFPNTFKEAMSLLQAARWKAAADKEIASLKKYGVYELLPASSVPAGQKVVGSRWVNKIKVGDLFKSYLEVLGWAQVPGIDCGGTFAPVCRLQSIRIMLIIAAKLDYEVLMLDVQTAFLNPDVEEEVYIKMSPGHETYDKSRVPFVMKLKLTMEAELVAAATAMKESLFCRNMTMESGFTEGFWSVPVYIDNTSALHVAGNRTFSPRAKHIALRYFFVQELVKEGKVSIHFVKTDQQLADLGMKHLEKHRHRFLIKLINEFRARAGVLLAYRIRVTLFESTIYILHAICIEREY